MLVTMNYLSNKIVACLGSIMLQLLHHNNGCITMILTEKFTPYLARLFDFFLHNFMCILIVLLVFPFKKAAMKVSTCLDFFCCNWNPVRDTIFSAKSYLGTTYDTYCAWFASDRIISFQAEKNATRSFKSLKCVFFSLAGISHFKIRLTKQAPNF